MSNGTPRKQDLWIPLSEVSDQPQPSRSVHSLSEKELVRAKRSIETLLANPAGIQNGKKSRKFLTDDQKERLKTELLHALQHAAVFAVHGPLPNKIRGRGRPPDNAVSIFIDDIMEACKAVSLRPGLRYVDGQESFPVQVFLALAPLLWGPTRNPRRLFERWATPKNRIFRGR